MNVTVKTKRKNIYEKENEKQYKKKLENLQEVFKAMDMAEKAVKTKKQPKIIEATAKVTDRQEPKKKKNKKKRNSPKSSKQPPS